MDDEYIKIVEKATRQLGCDVLCLGDEEILVLNRLIHGYLVSQGVFSENKAENYDELRGCVPLVHHLTFEQVVLEYKTMHDKLEAAREWNNQILFRFGFKRQSIRLSRSDIMELKEILGKSHDSTPKAKAGAC